MRPFALALFAALAASPATADCDHFKWSVAKDVAALAAAAPLPAVTGKAVPGAGYTLVLSQDVKLPFPPERSPAKGTYAGVLSLDGLQAGLYQVTLSDEAWIDVAQNDALVKSSDFSGQRDCPGARKSVRFPLGKGTATVQISGATASTISLVILKAE